MNRLRPELRLERILVAFSLDLAEATDAEVLEAAEDLGLKPAMKGTVAYVGLKHFVAPYPRGSSPVAEASTELEGEAPPTKSRPKRDPPDRN